MSGQWRARIWRHGGQPDTVCVVDKSGREVIAWTGFDGVQGSKAEIRARAKLVAAAPTLLDQHDSNLVDLEMLRRAISEGDPKAELLIRVDDIVRRTKEAIAKAPSPVSPNGEVRS